MKYKVHARDWDEELKTRFGDEYSQHELTGDQVVEALRLFGRAQITETGLDYLVLSFHNDYD